MSAHKLAILSFRRPARIIGLVLIFLVFGGYYAFKLPSVLQGHGLQLEGSYHQVQNKLASEFGIPADPVILLYENEGGVNSDYFRKVTYQIESSLQRISGFMFAESSWEREDRQEGNFAYTLAAFRQQPHEMRAVLGELRKLLPEDPHISVKITGKAAVQEDVNAASTADLQKAELIGIPAAFIIMLIAFGGVVLAVIPLLIGVSGVVIAMGIMYAIGVHVELSNFVYNVIPMAGLALSVDFALIVVSRFREEIRFHRPEEAMSVTMKTAGRAVLLSAGCVLLGLTGVMFIPLPIFSTVAAGAVVVLVVSVLLTFTLLPALLSLAVGYVLKENRGTRRSRSLSHANLMHSMTYYVMQRPIRMVVVSCLLLVVCTLPVLAMKVSIPDETSLPVKAESRFVADVLHTHFDGPLEETVYLLLEGRGDRLEEKDWINAHMLTQILATDPDVQRVDSVFSHRGLSGDQWAELAAKPGLFKLYESYTRHFVHNNRMLIAVKLKNAADSKQAINWVRKWERLGKGDHSLAEIRDSVKSKLIDHRLQVEQTPDKNSHGNNITFLLGGKAKYEQEIRDTILEYLPGALLFIVGSNLIVLFLAFRSILVPIKTVLMNFLSLGASFGILAWVFSTEEWGLGTEPGRIAIMIPVFIFGLVFGISMDYGIFLVSRIAESYRITGDNHASVLLGTASTSRIITSAAAIMIAVTLPFALGDVVGVKQLGIGIAAAIFIDATIIRLILVPSLMKLMGKWNWWAP
ncbi:MMPL family transporter [Paenibacillus sp. FJAT-26967]|uniref:MMPL family transporter n=1 Tax=Paenibacillus sp. FJAT-26967 TaxID=1729690 RepID=UPI000837DE2C|nr:MMPL family transporter [Paenibacillus sp. FJAT-26967]